MTRQRSRITIGLQLGTALALAALAVAAARLEPRAIALLAVAATTPALIRFDLRERRLPNRIVLPAIAAGLVAVSLGWLFTGASPTGALVSGAAYFVFLLVLGLTGGMGMGDVKLAAALGIAAGTLGVSVALLSPLLAFLAGGVGGIVGLIRKRRTLAFGPFMLGGFWAAVLLCWVRGAV